MILHNRAKCLSCGDIIESKHRHDFVWCKCGRIFVDGGLAYLRRGWPDDDGPTYEELSEETDESSNKEGSALDEEGEAGTGGGVDSQDEDASQEGSAEEWTRRPHPWPTPEER